MLPDGAPVVDNVRLINMSLIVMDFLGASSEPVYVSVARLHESTPTVRIDAPPLLKLRSDMQTSIAASTELSPCFRRRLEGQIAVNTSFQWTVSKVTALEGYDTSPTLDEQTLDEQTLDEQTLKQRVLSVAGSALKLGLQYTLRVEACVEGHGIRACSHAKTDVMLADQPLRAVIIGGHRKVGLDVPLNLNACLSGDVDEPELLCDKGQSCQTLSFAWTIFPDCDDADCDEPWPESPAAPSPTDCAWTIQPGELKASTYIVAVTVTKIRTGESSQAIREIEGVEGLLLSVVILKPAKTSHVDLHIKQNPDEHLALEASATWSGELDHQAERGFTYRYTWSCVSQRGDIAYDLTAMSTTGPNARTLVVRAGELTPGAQYTFTVVASSGGKEAHAYLTVSMNSRPWGGTLMVTPGRPYRYQAATTKLTLTSSGWFDELLDGPLTYSFSYRSTSAASTDSPAATQITTGSFTSSAVVVMPEGSWTVVVRVSDSYGASSTATADIIVDPLAFTAEMGDSMVTEIEVLNALQDTDGSSRKDHPRTHKPLGAARRATTPPHQLRR